MTATESAAKVDQARLWQRHQAMAKIGAIPGNGVNRQALTAEDIEARRLLLSWATARDFAVGADPIGNLFIRRPGQDPDAAPIMTGSHMDSQPQGGRFDGIYGVLCGLEALEALDQAGLATKRPIDLVAWTNEEGGRFAPGAMGSMVFTGARRLADCLEIRDPAGIALKDALAGTLAATPEAAERPFNFPVAGYLEAHIEQGPRLEALGQAIGVVTGIQGARWFDVEVTGETAHAGTTPLAERRDAVQAAIAMVGALNQLMADETDTVRFTVGRFDVTPNTPNSVAAKVSFSIDFRHPDATLLVERGDAIAATCSGAAKACAVAVTETLTLMPCAFDDTVVDTVEQAAADLDLAHMRLPSGAFHDAQFMSAVCPTAMIFVPCAGGISHNPAESAEPADLPAGARVLVACLAALANR